MLDKLLYLLYRWYMKRIRTYGSKLSKQRGYPYELYMTLDKKLDMSTEKLTDEEIICYICEKRINILAELRKSHKERFTYSEDRLMNLRKKVIESVVEVTGSKSDKRVFRHGSCNPNNFLGIERSRR